MAITPIPNQPVNFNNIALPAECACMGQEFSQLVNKDDQTQFQIKSTSVISNGDFETDLTGWNIFEEIEIEAAITNESEAGECDGAITAAAAGGTAPYTYSIDGGAFGSGTFTGLCAGEHTIVAKDVNGNEGNLTIEVFTNIVCGDYEGATIQDLIDDGILLGQLYNCTLESLQP